MIIIVVRDLNIAVDDMNIVLRETIIDVRGSGGDDESDMSITA